jgi:hypothetical protein
VPRRRRRASPNEVEHDIPPHAAPSVPSSVARRPLRTGTGPRCGACGRRAVRGAAGGASRASWTRCRPGRAPAAPGRDVGQDAETTVVLPEPLAQRTTLRSPGRPRRRPLCSASCLVAIYHCVEYSYRRVRLHGAAGYCHTPYTQVYPVEPKTSPSPRCAVVSSNAWTAYISAARTRRRPSARSASGTRRTACLAVVDEDLRLAAVVLVDRAGRVGPSRRSWRPSGPRADLCLVPLWEV